MKKKKHQPPSKIKYNQTHPTVSIRVSQDLYDQLKDLREKSGKSLGDILRESLGKQAPSTKKAFQRGFDKARRQFVVTYRCSVCGGPLEVTTDEEKKEVAMYMRSANWAHTSCLDK